MKIFVIRHGQTTSDVENRYGGDYDDHLTDLGVSEVKKLTGKIKDFGIEIFFVSPKIRTNETAKILTEKIQVPVKTVEGFRERNQNGILSGMKRDEAKEKYPEMVELLKDKLNTIEGAEAYEPFKNRVVTAFKEVSGAGYKIIGVITHGGPIRRILGDILGMEAKWEIADCGWLEIEADNDKFKLVKTSGITEEKK